MIKVLLTRHKLDKISADSCLYNEYLNDGYRPLHGSDCSAFCQCSPLITHEDGSVEYYWVRHDCSPGTLWSQDLLTCDHWYNVQCSGKGLFTANFFLVFLFFFFTAYIYIQITEKMDKI